jgi:hypothetical protein
MVMKWSDTVKKDWKEAGLREVLYIDMNDYVLQCKVPSGFLKFFFFN